MAIKASTFHQGDYRGIVSAMRDNSRANQVYAIALRDGTKNISLSVNCGTNYLFNTYTVDQTVINNFQYNYSEGYKEARPLKEMYSVFNTLYASTDAGKRVGAEYEAAKGTVIFYFCEAARSAIIYEYCKTLKFDRSSVIPPDIFFLVNDYDKTLSHRDTGHAKNYDIPLKPSDYYNYYSTLAQAIRDGSLARLKIACDTASLTYPAR
ncbi:hypothetical protein [Breznakiella homolactica]|uniref:Uncharacterized protein n=1 Tax=Breznakiella homolactica TaxID=2798577 RepID=A0A7T8BB37_9SPIR|nr:hypothetical protein [Breznakiella homolactica]QQO10142.1 hypothetical protein JFL75_04270 [Breznakiella homolactica]